MWGKGKGLIRGANKGTPCAAEARSFVAEFRGHEFRGQTELRLLRSSRYLKEQSRLATNSRVIGPGSLRKARPRQSDQHNTQPDALNIRASSDGSTYALQGDTAAG
jgi:hypothetical protein